MEGDQLSDSTGYKSQLKLMLLFRGGGGGQYIMALGGLTRKDVWNFGALYILTEEQEKHYTDFLIFVGS